MTGGSVSVAAEYGGWLSFTYAIMQFVFAPIAQGLTVAAGWAVALQSLAAITLLALRMGFGMALGFLNALLCHGLVLFATDLYNLAVLPGISFSWERIGHSFLGSVQFGLIWVTLVGKITLTAGVLFGALTGLLLPSFAGYLQRGRAALPA